MREVGSLLCLPVGALLKVEHLVEGRVALFAICVESYPVIPVYSVALCVLKIYLSNGNLTVAALTALCLDGKITAGYRLVEFDSLPAVACLEFSLQCWGV